MKLTPPFKILCTSKEMLEKVLLILLSHNNTWRSGHTTLKFGEQSFNFDSKSIQESPEPFWFGAFLFYLISFFFLSFYKSVRINSYFCITTYIIYYKNGF